MNHDYIRIKHMYDAAEEILRFTHNKKRSDMYNDRQLSLSVVRLLEIIGEAANKVTTETQNTYTHIPWKQIIDMRNRLIHGYFDIDLDIIWETVVNEIPLLFEELKAVIRAMD